MTPEQYSQNYLSMTVNLLMYEGPDSMVPIWNLWDEFVSIDRYRSKLTKKAQTAREGIRRWLKNRSELAGSGIEKVAKYHWRVKPLYNDFDITDDDILRTVAGKGSPDEINRVLKVVSMMTRENQKNMDLLGADNIYDFIQWYIGQDCNGFICNYFKATVSDSGLNHGVDVYGYKDGKEITAVKDIKAFDLLFPKTDGEHIAIISSISPGRTDSELTCRVTESRGAQFGGIQTNTWKITKDSEGWKMTSGGSPRKVLWVYRHRCTL